MGEPQKPSDDSAEVDAMLEMYYADKEQLTPEQIAEENRRIDRCCEYIGKYNIGPNLDSIY